MRFLLLLALISCTSSEATDGAASTDAERDAEPRGDATFDAQTEAEAGPRDAEMDGSMEPEVDAGEDAGVEPRTMLVFVGTGSFGGSSGSIVSHRFDPTSGELARTASIAAGDLASFLAFDPVRGIVHVADEGAGRVLSFEIADDDGRLRYLDERTSRGNPVYVLLDAARTHLLVAHYNQGRTETFGVQANGAVGDAIDLETSGAQSHSVRLTPDDRYALVPAKADDWIAQYLHQDGQLTENTPPRAMTAAGAGPRHLDFHPDGVHVYVVNEDGNSVDAYRMENGALTNIQTVSALPAGFSGQSTGADIHVHPNGRFLYSSERVVGGQGLIAIFSIDADGMLTPIGHEETRGETPRNFGLTPDGSYLLAANQGSNDVAVFTIDANTGLLQYVRTQEIGASPFFVGVLIR